MICGECGADNLAGRTYCGTCGKPMRPDRERVIRVTHEKAILEARHRWGKGLERLLGLLIVLFLAAIVFRGTFGREDLPSYDEIPVVAVFESLPVLDSELFSHPYVDLPVPE